jgi:2-oxoglutarate ferredoxin oxidoreductase subunit delta
VAAARTGFARLRAPVGTGTSVQGQITIDRERCKGCTFCIEFCPTKSICMSEELNLKGYFVAAFIPDSGCNGCGTCALMCPEVAIEVVRL